MSTAMNRLLEQHQRMNPTVANTTTASVKPTASSVAGKRVGLSVALAGITPSASSKPTRVVAEDEGFGATGIPSRYKYPFKMPEGTWHIIVDFMRKGTTSFANGWSFSSPSNKVLPKPTILLNGIVKSMKSNNSYHLFDTELYDIYIRCSVASKDPALRNSLHGDDTYSFGPCCIGYEGSVVTQVLSDVKAAKVQILSVEHEPRIRYASGSNVLFGSKPAQASEMMSDADLQVVTSAVNEITTPAKYETAMRILDAFVREKRFIVDATSKDENVLAGHSVDNLVRFRDSSGRFAVYARKSPDKPWVIREQFSSPSGRRAGMVYLANLLKKNFLATVPQPTKNKNKKAQASTETTVTSTDKISDRVASIVYGDIKRIQSTIKAWKGKMKPEEYKEFEAYQNFVATSILKKYLPLVSDAYAQKIRAI